jgi:hypothetical protein
MTSNLKNNLKILEKIDGGVIFERVEGNNNGQIKVSLGGKDVFVQKQNDNRFKVIGGLPFNNISNLTEALWIAVLVCLRNKYSDLRTTRIAFINNKFFIKFDNDSKILEFPNSGLISFENALKATRTYQWF